MKKIITQLVLGVVIAISAGCPSVPTKSAGGYFTTTDQNTIVHTPSGVQFPEKIGDFMREGTHNFDPSGFDVSAAYNLRNPTMVAATVYVYPSPKVVSFGSPDDVVRTARETMTNSEFDYRKKEIIGAHKGARLIGSRNITGIEGVFGRYADFEYVDFFAGRTQSLHSRLYLFTYFDGKWTIKYRITYPTGAISDEAVDAFVKAYRWK